MTLPLPSGPSRWALSLDDVVQSAASGLERVLEPIGNLLRALGPLVEVGALRAMTPAQTLRSVAALGRWGFTPAGGYAVWAVRQPQALAIVDEAVVLTYDAVHRRTNALARALADRGVGPTSTVGLLCRNHHWFVETMVALSKTGATIVHLNTELAAPQLGDVLVAEGIQLVVHDADLETLVLTASRSSSRRPRRLVAWHEGTRRFRVPTLDELVAAAGDSGDGAGSDDVAGSDPDPPARPARQVVLTSGTTGAPRGAERGGEPVGIEVAVALLERVPFRYREIMLVATPCFHTWGLAHLGIALLPGATVVLQRRFEPEPLLAAVAEHHVTVLVVVPAMLQRLVELPDDVRRRYDTSSLRIVMSSGSALPAQLATRFMDEFGDVLYNVYGSTEVAWGSIAGPDDLRAAPGTAGRPPRGTEVLILDPADSPAPAGTAGRIFVRNSLLFPGYTRGGTRPLVDGFMGTGDLGHFDADGRLFVDGREDDMIVSGGENVFPAEVEETLATHPAVADAAVVGVPDERFGQRLKAFVVLRSGSSATAADLRAHVRVTLARYKVPRDVELVDELPRTATGKVPRHRLTGAG